MTLMQVFLTIVTGVAVYVLGQAILHFVFEPIKKFNEQRSDTSFLLLFHQAKITNASNTNPQLQDDIKEMGAALISTMSLIPCYHLLTWLRVFGLPSKEDVFQAARELNGIAYGTGPVGPNENSAVANTQALEQIARLLGIHTGYN
jgi:hypothetical protein